MTKKILIYTDGGARGNPGPAAIGVVITDNQQLTTNNKIHKFSKYIGEATNNVAEYKALIFALRKAHELYKVEETEIEIRMDSELVVRQMKGEYRVKDRNLQILFSEALGIIKKFKTVSFTHILREKNAEADELVNAELDRLKS